jgi:hypothetical protein
VTPLRLRLCGTAREEMGVSQNNDLTDHVATYDGLIRLFKIGLVAVAIVTALVIWLIAG